MWWLGKKSSADRGCGYQHAAPSASMHYLLQSGMMLISVAELWPLALIRVYRTSSKIDEYDREKYENPDWAA